VDSAAWSQYLADDSDGKQPASHREACPTRCLGCSIDSASAAGPGDNFDLENSHVIPALIRKIHDAKESGAASEYRSTN
jgi:hypothetical protein